MSVEEAFDKLLEEAKQNDPEYLRKQILELQAQVNELKQKGNSLIYQLENTYFITEETQRRMALFKKSISNIDNKFITTHDNEVIEKCAEKADARRGQKYPAHMIGIDIRNLKTKD